MQAVGRDWVGMEREEQAMYDTYRLFTFQIFSVGPPLVMLCGNLALLHEDAHDGMPVTYFHLCS